MMNSKDSKTVRHRSTTQAMVAPPRPIRRICIGSMKSQSVRRFFEEAFIDEEVI